MGRPPKNANHVLVRLRRAISTPGQTVTREILAKRIGVSASTIREIETQGFKLTEAVVARLMIATGVSTRSLMNGEDPLKDIFGNDLNPKSSVVRNTFGRSPNVPQELAAMSMMDAALLAAVKKKSGAIFHELFMEWLPKALEAIGAVPAMKEILNGNLGEFDPGHVPAPLQPTHPGMKRKWEEASRELARMTREETKDDPAAFGKAYQDILENGRLRDRLSKKSTHPKPSSGKQ